MRYWEQPNNSDNYQTPDWAAELLLPYLPKDWHIWEPAQGEGRLVKFLESHGYTVTGTDITQGQDFLWYSPESYSAIITNPPFSISTKWVGRCYALDKPFALLLPIYCLEGKRRHDLFKEHGISVIIPRERINYLRDDNETNKIPFASAWFTFGLGVDPLVFV